MANIFDPDIQTARELIALYGMDVGWLKAPAAEEGDAPGYSTPAVPPAPVPVKMAFFRGKDVGYGGDVFAALMAGTEVPTGNEVGLLAGGQAFTPEDADTILRDGTELAITKIDRLAPNGTPILFFVMVSS